MGNIVRQGFIKNLWTKLSKYFWVLKLSDPLRILWNVFFQWGIGCVQKAILAFNALGRSISRKRPPANLTCTSSGTQSYNIWIQLNYLCRSWNPFWDVGNAATDKSAYLLPYRPCIGAINAEILKGQCITDSMQSSNFYGFAIYATNNYWVKIVGLAVHCLNRKKCIVIILTQHISFWI